MHDMTYEEKIQIALEFLENVTKKSYSKSEMEEYYWNMSDNTKKYFEENYQNYLKWLHSVGTLRGSDNDDPMYDTETPFYIMLTCGGIIGDIFFEEELEEGRKYVSV